MTNLTNVIFYSPHYSRNVCFTALILIKYNLYIQDIEILEKILKIAIVLSLLVLLSCTLGDKKRSSEEDKSLVYFSHGTKLLMKKEYTKALKLLSQAYELDPNNAEINNNFGMAYYFRGAVDKAVKHLKMSIKQDPKNMDSRNNLASIYFKTQDYTKALREYSVVEQDLTYEFQYKILYNISLVYEQLGDLSKSVDYLGRSLKENLNYCPASFKLAMFSYKAEDYEKALELFKKATMGLCVQLPDTHFYTAKTLVHLKKYFLAHKKFVEVQEKFSDTKYFAMADTEIKHLRSFNQDLGPMFEIQRELEKKNSFRGATF